MIKVGISTYTKFWRPEKIFEIAQKLEVGIEFLPMRWHNLSYIHKIQKRFPKVEILGVHAPFSKNFFGYLEDFKQRKFLQKIRPIIWATILGGFNDKYFKIVKNLNCYLNFHPRNFVSGYKSSLIENPYLDEGVVPLEEIKKMADEDNIGTTLDTSHTASVKGNLLEAFEILQPRVIHLSDSKLGKHGHLSLGKGELPLVELLNKIKQKDNDYIIIIELKPMKNYKEAIELSLDFLRKNGINF